MRKQTHRFCRDCEEVLALSAFRGSEPNCRWCEYKKRRQKEEVRHAGWLRIKEKIVHESGEWTPEVAHRAAREYRAYQEQVLTWDAEWEQEKAIAPRDCIACRQKLPASAFRARSTICTACSRKQHVVRSQAQKALKAGRIVKQAACEVCADAPTELLHHPDYTQPLLVMSLCQQCHRRIHINLDRIRAGRNPIPLEYW